MREPTTIVLLTGYCPQFSSSGLRNEYYRRFLNEALVSSILFSRFGSTFKLTLAGDGMIAVEVEALEVLLRDVTRPYVAPSGKLPGHPD